MIRWLITLVSVMSMMSAALAADIGVSPPRLEMTLPVGGTETTTFTAVWNGKDAVQLGLSVSDWTMSESGDIAFLPAGDGQHSAASWIHLQGDTIEMQGPEQRDIRMTVQVPDDPSLAGTYAAVVFVSTSATPTGAAGTKVSMRQRVGVVVYVTIAGTETNGSKLADMYSNGQTLYAVVANQGNTVMHYSGSIEVRNQSGATVKTLSIGDSAILRESERDITVKMPDLPKGYYVLLLLLKDSRGGLLTGQLPYEVK